MEKENYVVEIKDTYNNKQEVYNRLQQIISQGTITSKEKLQLEHILGLDNLY